MNCENVEPLISDYIDELLDRSAIADLQVHLRFCPDCQETLAGMRRVRQALHNLGGMSSPASFKLRLSNCLQEELHRERWAWMRPVAWGFALATALAILLWPEPEPASPIAAVHGDLGEGEAWTVPAGDRRLGRTWTDRFPELAHSDTYARIRPASF